MQTLETKKKIVNFFLKKGLLVNNDLLRHLENKNDFLLVTGTPNRWYWRIFDDDNTTEIFRKEVFKQGAGWWCWRESRGLGKRGPPGNWPRTPSDRASASFGVGATKEKGRRPTGLGCNPFGPTFSNVNLIG